MVTNTTLTTELVETGEKRDRIGRKITPGPRVNRKTSGQELRMVVATGAL